MNLAEFVTILTDQLASRRLKWINKAMNAGQTNGTWQAIEIQSDDNDRHSESNDWLLDLANADIPAIIFRNAFAPNQCQQVVEDLVANDLLFDASNPVPEKFREQSIPEGFFRKGTSDEKFGDSAATDELRCRIDIGTSLGYRGNDPEHFFAHAAETNQLFKQLFDSTASPIDTLYDRLGELDRTKTVKTAHESDGRTYGPAIIRAHYGSYTYAPHFDSVRLREERSNYAVYRFQHQFAGVLVLQNSDLNGASAQSILHRQLWQPEIDSFLQQQKFHDYASKQQIENLEVELNQGDLYFFNTRCIHEVPGLASLVPRIVLATFIGYSPDDPEIFVWS